MANKILTTLGWEERVRAKLRLSSNQLPDADIQQPDIIDIAEALITDAVSTWAEIIAAGGNKKIYLESAVVNACASLLCPSMPQRLAMVKGPLMTIDYGETDWAKKAEELWGSAVADMGRCNDAGTGTYTPVVPFIVSGPSRAGVTWWPEQK